MRKTEEIQANIDQYIDSIFDKLPSNAIINKGRCGIGGTTLEIETNRNSIIVVPTIGIINDKCNNYEKKYKSNPRIFGIHGTISKEELIEMLTDKHPVKKIFTTPSGLRKLMECGYPKESIMQNWFLLLDEYHTSATDAFRDDILIPFDYFWEFPKENRAMISATPIKFSDSRIGELDVFNIMIKEKLGKIEIIHTESVLDCLSYALRNSDQFNGNIHIFFNSVSEIANAIRSNMVGYDTSVYIAKSERNMDKLDELGGRFYEKPSPENFSKFNFYTSRYFEGWDLEDKNPTIILVTDTRITTTKLGIRNKAFQAVGRSRNPIDRIFHITNDRNKKELKTFQEIKRQHKARALSVVKGYNEHVNDSTVGRFEIKANQKEIAEEYARINKDTNLAQRCSYLTDQFINQDYCDQDYNHIDYIKEAWNEMNYNIEVLLFDTPEVPSDFKKSSLTYKIMGIVGILDLIEKDKDRFFINRYSDINNLLPEVATEWIDAYNILGREAMIDVDYSHTEIRKLVIEKHNLEQEEELRKRILASFPKGEYSCDSIKTLLHKLNIELGVKNSKGIYKPGKTADLHNYFNIKPDGVSIKVGRENYDAEFGKYNFIVDGEKSRKQGFKFY